MNQPTRFIDLSELALIMVSGEDAASFLQNLTTNDVARLPRSRAQYNSLCSAKGRMIASFLLLRTGDGYLLQLPASLAEALQKRLAAYKLRSKVSICSASRVQIGVDGDSELLAEHFRQLPEQPLDLVETENAILIRLSPRRIQLLLAPGHPLPGQLTVEPGSLWEYLEITEGIPCIYPETVEQYVPQMVNFEALGGVSFNKGCYPGQEVVARTQHLGKIKRRMIRAKVDAECAPPGSPVFCAELAAGTVVRCAPAPQGGCELLAVIPLDADGQLRLGSATGPVLQPLSLPYTVS